MASKLVSIVLTVALVAALVLVIVWARPKTASTGIDGFASYDEMMAAHHPQGGAAGAAEDGCGGASGGSGELSNYGVTYDDAGYKQLTAAQSIRLTSAQTDMIVGLDIQMPCCD